MSTIQSIIQSTIRPTISSVIGDDGFTPAVLSNRAVWLNAKDASTLTFNGSTISSWRNKGNLGVGNATQATALRQPLYVANAINGRPAMRGFHDNTNSSRLEMADSAGLDYTAFEVYAVIRRQADNNGDERIIGKSLGVPSKREFQFQLGVNDNLVLGISPDNLAYSFASSNAAKPEQTIPLNQPRILSGQYNPALSSNRARVFVNNITGDFTTNPAVAHLDTSPITIFSDTAFNNAFRGDIGELLFFTRILTTNERVALMNYLSREWGIAI